ncbi:MAG: alanine racemase C-terminal domain-containing protein, partial [Actinomycetota bacterium]|nr:alanine racemase C-terminal domain-containing protein [Actinomycetota bacterium]
DLCMVDMGDALYEPGEEATIIGGYGMEHIGVERMAEERGTINYEVVCGIGKRVPRIYLNRL